MSANPTFTWPDVGLAMSWRILFVLLLLMAGVSAWGGISLGHWLVSHGPQAPMMPENLLADVPVLDADGQPFTAQPPQPLVNGQLGVPDSDWEVDWRVAEQSLAFDKNRPPIAIATSPITSEQARELSQSGDGLQGLADVGDLIGALEAGDEQALQPIELPEQPAAPEQSSPGTANGNWQTALRREIDACSRLGFFERPSCAWTARNKYCGPNQAWGTTRDCPAKSF